MAFALLIGACSRHEEPAGNDKAPVEAAETAPAIEAAPAANPAVPSAEPAAAAPSVADSQKTPEAAAAVLRDYFRLIEQKDYVEAHKLWSSNAAHDDLSDGAFAASFDEYRSYRAVVGAAGQMEGAAGSSYIDLPVTVTGELKSGGPFRLEGPVTLRRVNGVPGATPEQLQWRIMRSALKPRP